MKTMTERIVCTPQRRRGIAPVEVVMVTAMLVTFTMGLYFLGEQGCSRLYHFIASMVGSPYL